MAPFKSSLSRSASKLLSSFRERDLSLRGYAQSTRFVSDALIASGGLTVEDGGYMYHVFTSPGTFTVDSLPQLGSADVETVVVGGGGGGYPGSPAGGGGAGGGVRISTVAVTSPISVTVSPAATASASGGTSSFGPKSAPGGRGATGNNGADSYPSSPSNGPELFQLGAGSSSNGDAGGAGGGAGSNGGPAPGSVCGGTGAAGGDGKATNFPGPAFTPIMPADFVNALGPTGYLGGGGAGGMRCAPGGPNTAGPGGLGGGGFGGSEPGPRSGQDGIANTGGGGGGGHSFGGGGGDGASGVVIVRYSTS